MLVEDRPERCSLPQLFSSAAPEGNNPVSNVDRVLRGFDARGREVELEGFRITMNEIENAVAAGIHAGDQV